MGVIKICIFCVCATLLAITLKEEKTHYGVLISLAICIVMIGIIMSRFLLVIDFLNELKDKIPVESIYVQLLLKMTGVTYVAELTSDLCAEAGYKGIARQIQIFGKISILILGIPVITSIIDLMTKIFA